MNHALTRVVLHEGRVSGIWEWDPDTGRVEAGPYAPGLPEDTGQVAADVARLLTELGHGRSFSLDSDDKVRRRLALVLEL